MPHADGRPTKEERKAAAEKAKREAAAAAAKRGPKIQPKMGKFNVDREKADESLRIVRFFKEFSERGKVPIAMVPQMVKELFKDREKPLQSKLVALGKEALTAKAKASGEDKLTAGDFSGWYFDVAWPAVIEFREEKKASEEAKKAAEAAAAAEAAEAAAREAAAAAEEAARLAAAEAAAKAEAEALEADRLAREQALAERQREEEEAEKGEPLIPKALVRTVLNKALDPIEDSTLLGRAPKPVAAKGGVPLGHLVKFWFEEVWPKHGAALLAGGEEQAQMDGQGAEETGAAGAVDVE